MPLLAVYQILSTADVAVRHHYTLTDREQIFSSLLIIFKQEAPEHKEQPAAEVPPAAAATPPAVASTSDPSEEQRAKGTKLYQTGDWQVISSTKLPGASSVGSYPVGSACLWHLHLLLCKFLWGNGEEFHLNALLLKFCSSFPF